MRRRSAMSHVAWAALLAVSTACMAVHGMGTATHTNNWAVLVSTSRYWFNYRHSANVLSMYRTVKRLGIPDSQIVLMLAEDIACNPRNAHAGQVFNSKSHAINLYGDEIEVDYRGAEVTVETFLRVLTGRHDPAVPNSKRLLTDENSNILIFMSGHGGNEFLKFQDQEELSSQDIADAIAQMHDTKRYNEIFFVVDTCQASTLYNRISSPNVLAMSSSIKDESSYSYEVDMDTGVYVIDRFTYFILAVMEKVDISSHTKVMELFRSLRRDRLASTAHIRTDLLHRDISTVRITDFFGSVLNTRMTKERYPFIGDFVPTATKGRAALAASMEPLKVDPVPVLSNAIRIPTQDPVPMVNPMVITSAVVLCLCVLWAALLGHVQTGRTEEIKRVSSFLMMKVTDQLSSWQELANLHLRRGKVPYVKVWSEVDKYYIEVYCTDRPGLLSDVTMHLRSFPLEIMHANISTEDDGYVRDTFQVQPRGDFLLDVDEIEKHLQKALLLG